jgi:hypothetical protein
MWTDIRRQMTNPTLWLRLLRIAFCLFVLFDIWLFHTYQKNFNAPGGLFATEYDRPDRFQNPDAYTKVGAEYIFALPEKTELLAQPIAFILTLIGTFTEQQKARSRLIKSGLAITLVLYAIDVTRLGGWTIFLLASPVTWIGIILVSCTVFTANR